MAKYAINVKESSSGGGVTGGVPDDLTLAGAVTGFVAMTASGDVAVGDHVIATIKNDAGAMEMCVGKLTSTTNMERVLFIRSTTGSWVDFSADSSQVSLAPHPPLFEFFSEYNENAPATRSGGSGVYNIPILETSDNFGCSLASPTITLPDWVDFFRVDATMAFDLPTGAVEAIKAYISCQNVSEISFIENNIITDGWAGSGAAHFSKVFRKSGATAPTVKAVMQNDSTQTSTCNDCRIIITPLG